ncbi:MAG: OmpA family protein [Cytophagales bacterium]|nr:OmpA family protein [Bernardetiaceae bacterium]MDW8204965.1 OmpA family protein [Cytophagales bacterium]
MNRRIQLLVGIIGVFFAVTTARAQSAKDIEPLPPFEGFEAVYAQQTPFMVQGNKRGEKIHIKYNFKGSNPPTFVVVLDYYLQLTEAKGGKAQKRQPNQQIFEYTQNGKDFWIQITEVRAGSYELIAIEKDTPAMNALAEDIPQDAPNSKDYPLLPRLPNYYIGAYSEENFFSNGQVSGYKYQINYKFDVESGETPLKDEKVVQHYIGKVRSYGGKIIRNDGATATMDFTKDQVYCWVQVGSFGNGYELIVVEKDLTGKTQYAQKSQPYQVVQPVPAEKQRIVENAPAKAEVVLTKPAEQKTQPKEQSAPLTDKKDVEQKPHKQQTQPTAVAEKLPQQKTETVIVAKNQPVAKDATPAIAQDLAGAKDYDPLGRFKGYVISKYKLEDFYMGYQLSGIKYQINYFWENPTQKPPTDEEVVAYYTGKVKALGGRVIRNDGATATLEFTENNIYRWVQIGSFGVNYELVVVEKDLNRNYTQPIAQNKPYEVGEDRSGVQVRTTTGAVGKQSVSTVIAAPAREQREMLATARPVPVPQADIANARDYEQLPRRKGYVISNYREEDFYMGYKLSGLKYHINYQWSKESEEPPADEDVIGYYKGLIKQYQGRIIRDDGPTATMEYTHNNVYRWVQVGAFGRSYELVIVEKDLNRNYDQPVVQNKPYTVESVRGGGQIAEGSLASTDILPPAAEQISELGITRSAVAPRIYPTADVAGSGDFRLMKRLPGYLITAYSEGEYKLTPNKTGYKYQINYTWADPDGVPFSDEQVVSHYVNLAKSYGGRAIRDDGPTATLEFYDGATYYWAQVGAFGNSYELIVIESGVSTARNTAEPNFSAETAAKRMLRNLTEQGKVVLRSIQFENENSATLATNSEQTLAIIAQLLKEKTDLKLVIVVHTARGKSIEADLLLSDQRAKTVARQLIAQFGISESRIEARGVGSLAPIAPNTAAGRAENERIELLMY